MKPDESWSQEMRQHDWFNAKWVDDTMVRTLKDVTYAQVPSGQSVNTDLKGLILPDARPTTSEYRPNVFTASQDEYFLGEFKTTKTDILLTAAIGKMNELITQLSQPSDPGSDEYEDGFNACLALVEQFRDELRRQEGTL